MLAQFVHKYYNYEDIKEYFINFIWFYKEEAMTKNKKYSVKKVTVAVTSILMGISVGSIGTGL